jgi:hypothetical protein
MVCDNTEGSFKLGMLGMSQFEDVLTVVCQKYHGPPNLHIADFTESFTYWPTRLRAVIDQLDQHQRKKFH